MQQKKPIVHDDKSDDEHFSIKFGFDAKRKGKGKPSWQNTLLATTTGGAAFWVLYDLLKKLWELWQ